MQNGLGMRSYPKEIRLTLKTKLILLIESLVVILVFGSGSLITIREKETLETELRKRGLALAGDVAKFAERPLLVEDLPSLRRLVSQSMDQDYVHYVVVLDRQGNVVMHSDLSEVGKTYSDHLNVIALNSKEPGCTRTTLPMEGESLKEESLCDIFVPIQVSGIRLGTVRLGYSYSAVEEVIAQARRQIFLIGFVTVLIGGVAAYFLATFISSPILRVTDAIEALANDSQTTPLTIKRKDEIGTLVNSFNEMARDLESHRKHLEKLVEGRTAELKTTNQQLQREINDRKMSEKALKRSRERLRDLASHLESIREEERTRIAREIHDELGQALTALKMDTHWIGQRLFERQHMLLEKTKSMSKLIDRTVQSVQRISSTLRPGLLDDLGLSAAVEWQAAEFQHRTSVQTEVTSIPDDITLNQALSTALFRIFQEALTNIARHANATKAEVILRKTHDQIELTVRDNGKGITKEQISDSRSFGLIGMRERVHPFMGSFAIAGKANKGSTVTVRIPLQG